MDCVGHYCPDVWAMFNTTAWRTDQVSYASRRRSRVASHLTDMTRLMTGKNCPCRERLFAMDDHLIAIHGVASISSRSHIEMGSGPVDGDRISGLGYFR
jgi:hypothetical protein